MTREEAIEELEQRLSTLRFVGGSYIDCVNGEALKMAIEALKQPEIIRCKECGYYVDGHCYMHNTEIYPDDYCSYALKPPHGGKLASMEGIV